MTQSRPIVEMEGISISFPGVKALDEVSFRLFPGGTSPDAIAPIGLAGAGEVEDHPVRIASTEFDKQLVSVTPNGDGTYAVNYELTMTQTGAADTYTLTDTFQFGAGATVVGAPVVTAPGVALNPGFNGTTDTTVAANVPIPAGAVHLRERPSPA